MNAQTVVGIKLWATSVNHPVTAKECYKDVQHLKTVPFPNQLGAEVTRGEGRHHVTREQKCS